MMSIDQLFNRVAREIGLELLNGMAPNIHVYTLAMPIKSSVAFFTLLVFLSFIADAVNGFFNADNEVLKVLTELSG